MHKSTIIKKDLRYFKQLEEKVEKAMIDLGEAKVEDIPKHITYRQDAVNDLRHYAKKCGEDIFPYPFENTEKLGFLKKSDPRYKEAVKRFLMTDNTESSGKKEKKPHNNVMKKNLFSYVK